MATAPRQLHVISISEPPEIELDLQDKKATLHFLGTDLTAIVVSMPMALLEKLREDIARELYGKPGPIQHS